MRTGDEGVAALDLVDQAVGQQKIKCPVDGNGCRPRPVGGHPFDDVIGAHRRMALGYAAEHVAPLAGQAAAAAGTGPFGPGDQVGGAMAVIVAGVEKHHNVTV